MSVNTWIIVAGDPAIGNLIDTARSLGGSVSVAVVGPRAVADTVAAAGVDKVVWFGEPGAVPAEAYATVVADAVAAATPGLVLAANRASDRVLLGATAARLQAPVLAAVSSITADGAGLVANCSVFGGIAEETVTVTGPLALLLEGGPVPAASTTVPVEELPATPLGITVVETKPSSFEQVDLGAAPRVVGIGRGLKTQEDLALINALADAAKAEVACSRPVAEGLDWLGKDRYIGVSGAHITPDLYFAIGISGQLQHMVGVRGAKTIVAINTDPNAPVFKEADYCLVGDLYALVPALTAALK
ncbi:electron transfer flavoprotein subunit alpha/FixB family protein [Pengzhenrongella frigida]|uniref:Electron transfer flavoprotein subunit alpha/FixB family protein n=1 Tax=Pengzhenrongella frigida TaxID=1259133 RepID=A0A4Q5MZT2_9MICO|nr:electron transfer flavoprotein subunit alpha/FixB family protein [Cellulomonas sp. HLT2-17]RYV49737.1 electron transfer flavoprotein subunit alpha/FixB family protein [Cellulomonas sp. HLT2-17]